MAVIFCGFGSGLVVGGGALVVDGGSFRGHWGGVHTGDEMSALLQGPLHFS